MAKTTLRRRKDRLYGITDEANQYAFLTGDGEAVAALYANGLFVEDRGAHADGITTGRILLEDSEELVGPGSLIGDATVWDVEGDAVYTYEVPAGWVAEGFVYGAGWIWWVEGEEITAEDHSTTEVAVRLMRARADLTGVEQVGDEFVTPPLDIAAYDHYDPNASYRLGFALTAAAAIAYVRITPADPNHETTDPFKVFRVRWSMAGGSPDSDFYLSNVAAIESLHGEPSADGGATLLVAEDEVSSSPLGAWTQADDETSDPVEIWPESMFGDTAGPANVLSANVAPGGTVAQVYGWRESGESETYHLARASAVAAATAWAATAVVQPHPELGVVPDAMFIFGGS